MEAGDPWRGSSAPHTHRLPWRPNSQSESEKLTGAVLESPEHRPASWPRSCVAQSGGELEVSYSEPRAPGGKGLDGTHTAGTNRTITARILGLDQTLRSHLTLPLQQPQMRTTSPPPFIIITIILKKTFHKLPISKLSLSSSSNSPWRILQLVLSLEQSEMKCKSFKMCSQTSLGEKEICTQCEKLHTNLCSYKTAELW